MRGVSSTRTSGASDFVDEYVRGNGICDFNCWIIAACDSIIDACVCTWSANVFGLENEMRVCACICNVLFESAIGINVAPMMINVIMVNGFIVFVIVYLLDCDQLI
jgi:hypothetical protein